MNFQTVSWLLVFAILQVSDARQILQEIEDGFGFTDPDTVGPRIEELGDNLSELRLEEIEKLDNELSQLQEMRQELQGQQQQLQGQRQQLIRSRIEELKNQLAEQKLRGEQIEQQLTELRGQRIQDIENQLSQQELRGKRIEELEDQLPNQTIIRSQIEAIENQLSKQELQEQRIEELKNELIEQKLREQQTEQQLTEIRGQMHDHNINYTPNTECPTGFMPHDGSCYFFETGFKASWEGAMGYCSIMGANLVTIETAEEQNFLLEQAKARVECRGLWTAGSNLAVEAKWMWMKESKDVAYTAWAAGEPNNNNEKYEEDCLEMRKQDFLWNDAPCSFQKCFICEKNLTNIAPLFHD